MLATLSIEAALVRQMRHASELASPVFATPFPHIPVYIVTYDVIFWSVNLRIRNI